MVLYRQEKQGREVNQTAAKVGGMNLENHIGAEHETKGDDWTGASGTTIRDARPGSIASE